MAEAKNLFKKQLKVQKSWASQTQKLKLQVLQFQT